MSYFLSEEQNIAVASLRRFLDNDIDPIVTQYRDQFIPKPVMHEILQGLSQFGLVVAPLPEDVGGLGMDWGFHLRLLEEVSYTSADLGFPIFINTLIAQGMAGLSGANEKIKEKYLPGLMSGEIIGCSGISEPDTGSDAASMKMRAKIEDDAYVLNGEKMWVTNGVYSDFCIVICWVGEGENTRVTQIILDREIHGYEPKNISKIGLKSQSTTQIHFDNVRVPIADSYTRSGSSHENNFKGTFSTFELGRIHVAAICCGIARRALDEAIRYSQERVQHGKAIGGHQLIADKIAVMATELDAARLLALRAAAMVDQGIRCSKEISMAKWYANEMAVKATQLAMAIHGGNGLTTEFLVEKLARDALVCNIPDGTPEIQKLIIARKLTGIDAFK